MDDKIIVTNRAALLRKYGKTGTASIVRAVNKLIAADKKRGIATSLVYLDDAAAMKKLKGVAVQNPADPRENKNAIDAVFKALAPDYLMILGAPDVVPHQDMSNPAYDASGGGDDDPTAWGDLPYGCEAPYSRDPAKFIGPTRVVGRLPDLAGASKPTYLVTLLTIAAGYKSRPGSDYMGYFALSALVWKGSTRASLNNVFGNADKLLLAPPSGPAYKKGELKARMHFINCHGAPASPEFYGQKGGSYPVALDTPSTQGQITEGTVAAVECCYGGDLYDSITLGLDRPIPQSYLGQGAYGYLGSTTIAYGPADGNGSADLICQYFLLALQDGASLGRAALLARQRFADNAAQLDPIDLKTIAQFCLLGDPAIHPIAVAGAEVPKGVALAEAERFSRAERRAKLKQKGEFLARTKATAFQRSKGVRVSATISKALSNIAKAAGIRDGHKFIAYDVKSPAGSVPRGKAATAPSRYHLAIAKSKGWDSIPSGIAVVAKELNGRIIGYRVYHQR